MSLSEKEKASIQSVSINKHVEKPNSLSVEVYNKVGVYKKPIGGWGKAKANGIGYGRLDVGIKRKLRTIWKRAFIDIEKIVMEELENRLKSGGIFDSILPSGGDAEFTIRIITYGFYSKRADSKFLQPALSVEGELIKSDSTILWKSVASSGGYFSQLPSYTLKDFEDSPDLMREAINLVAKRVIGYLIDKL
jgi:hypothetical protein